MANQVYRGLSYSIDKKKSSCPEFMIPIDEFIGTMVPSCDFKVMSQSWYAMYTP